jgi:hypothetical protein
MWPTRGQRSITDYIIFNEKLRTMVLDVTVFQGPEIESDYFLVESKIRYWPRWCKRKSLPRAEDTYFKVRLSQDPSIRWLYQWHPFDTENSATEFEDIEEEFAKFTNTGSF